MSEIKIDEIVLREKERKLFISRVPKAVKEEFIQFANDEFEGDYGMCLKHIWDNFKMGRIFFENVDYKLNHILEILSRKEQKPDVPKINMLSGRKVKGGKDNGKN